MKNNNGNLNTNTRKPLGVSSKKLGVSGKGAPQSVYEKRTSSGLSSSRYGGGSSVIVITKSKNSSSSRHDGSMTIEEQEKRLKLLKMAEIDKIKQAAVEEKKNDAGKIFKALPEAIVSSSESTDDDLQNKVDVPNQGINKLDDIQADDAMHLSVSEVQVDSNVAQDIEASNERRNFIRSLASAKGKVPNLDRMFIGAAQKKSDVVEKKDNLESAASPLPPQELKHEYNKKSFPTAVTAQKKSKGYADHDESEVANKKISTEQDKKSARFGRRTFSNFFEQDDEEGEFIRRTGASIRKSRNKKNKKAAPLQDKVFRKVAIPDFITVQELANRMTEKATDVMKALMKMGVMATVNQTIDADTAELVVLELGHTAKRITDAEVEKAILNEAPESQENMLPRAPIITIMGHVDHGKTSLLDALRLTDVVAKEAGGITQHIGAYSVELENGRHITFLDTPGHEAFTAMRMRGAQVTDIVVLVVAADDGIKEQTIEAISHVKAAGVPVIVAVNKVDRPEANPERVKNELLSHDLVPEDMGGDVVVVNVSAKTKQGLDVLEETILLQSDLMSLSADPTVSASGTVIEARMDKNRGSVATLLVQRGTLKIGDVLAIGTCYGKVKALINDKGQNVKSCLPAYPVEILGLNQTPTAGDIFHVVENESVAKELTEFRIRKEKERKAAAVKKDSIETLFTRAKQGSTHKELPIIIRADVHGSAEAIASSLMKIEHDEVNLKVLHSGVGGVTESDITLAAASKALIVGFNVRASNTARDMANQLGVDVKYYSIIYNLIDDIKAALSGLLSPIIKEKLMGYAEIRQIFDLSKFGKVAGCIVTEGMVQRNASARLLRDNVVIHEGKLKALKRFKDDVKEVKSGFECGLSFERYDDLKVGDRVELFAITEEARQI